MRRYETVYLTGQEATEEAATAILKKVKGVIHSAGGRVVRVEHWGDRPLAFQVRKQLQARYELVDYMGKPGLVAEVERVLNLTEGVLRFMSTRIADEVDPATLPPYVEEVRSTDVGLDSAPRPPETEGPPAPPDPEEGKRDLMSGGGRP